PHHHANAACRQASIHAGIQIYVTTGGGIQASRYRPQACPVIGKAHRKNGESGQALIRFFNKNFGLELTRNIAGKSSSTAKGSVCCPETHPTCRCDPFPIPSLSVTKAGECHPRIDRIMDKSRNICRKLGGTARRSTNLFAVASAPTILARKRARR